MYQIGKNMVSEVQIVPGYTSVCFLLIRTVITKLFFHNFLRNIYILELSIDVSFIL